ncbi:MAG: DUF4249 domain-containing protein, partial [Bacteroidia bacterium]|nr:DUF4249 domain-containing protein [Bacteroidia bacterium]
MKKIGFVFILVIGCIDPYEPPHINQGDAILGIDGFINTNGKSRITLTRSQNLLDTADLQFESNAFVSIEDENGNLSFLKEEEPGKYGLEAKSFNDLKYRLHIRTTDSNEYVSDFVALKNSPAIDSISWDINTEKGVQIYINTHDAENKTQYYRWTFEETWQYTSAFVSTFIFENHTAVLRKDDIYTCWKTHASDKILAGSSTNLLQDIIVGFPIASIEQKAEKTRYKYSILVKQFALSVEAFEYWEQLKKTTEDLGTIFGPLPSRVLGNIRCLTEPNQPVLGFISGGTVTEKRIFISSINLPTPSQYITPYIDCEDKFIEIESIASFNGPFLLIGPVSDPII